MGQAGYAASKGGCGCHDVTDCPWTCAALVFELWRLRQGLFKRNDGCIARRSTKIPLGELSLFARLGDPDEFAAGLAQHIMKNRHAKWRNDSFRLATYGSEVRSSINDLQAPYKRHAVAGSSSRYQAAWTRKLEIIRRVLILWSGGIAEWKSSEVRFSVCWRRLNQVYGDVTPEACLSGFLKRAGNKTPGWLERHARIRQISESGWIG